MTNELAIRIITGDLLGTTKQTQEAITMAVKALLLPSAQPEIIRCKNCKDYQEGVDINGKPFSRCNGSVRTYGHTMPDWYCADAERREE